MASFAVMRCVLLGANLVSLSSGAAFLTARSELARDDVKQFLLAELAGRTDEVRLESIEEEMRPMYVSLPKSSHGRLEPATVRYALHRYFVQKHGWHVQGLDHVGETGPAPVSIMKDRAPAYIQSVFEEHMHGRGLGLRELAVFAATLEDLVQSEATGSLEWIYSAMDLPLVGSVTVNQGASALEYMLAAYLKIGGASASNPAELEIMKLRVKREYPDFDQTAMWLRDLRQSYDLAQASRHNPFVPRAADFDETVRVTTEFGHRFGSFQNLECHALKGKLSDMEFQGTGRVLLSTFYTKALAGAWEFMESVEYLRNQGSVDDSDPTRPSVMIANYMNSKTNCLAGSGFYAVCCMNECDRLLGQLEKTIASPSGSAARIASLVSSMHSDTVDAPRNLSSVSISRLEEIAKFHGGLVPLHGRMFAQWLHHAYPRECPYPHLSGTAEKAVTQIEWATKHGMKMLEVSRDVMQSHASKDDENKAADPGLLPWSFQEELLAEDEETKAASGGFGILRCLAALAGLASFAAPLARTFKRSVSSPAKGDNQDKLMV